MIARAARLPVATDFGAFWRDFEWMGVQRQLKVLGIFARLAHRAEGAGLGVVVGCRDDVRHPVRGPEPVEALEPITFAACRIGHVTTLG